MHEELKNKSNSLDHDKRLLEEEINNYRRQLEDFQSQKREESSTDREDISVVRNDNYEQYQLSVRRDDHSGLNTLFRHLHPIIDDSNEWRINLSKPLHQVNIEQMKTL